MRLTFALSSTQAHCDLMNQLQAPNILVAYPYQGAFPMINYAPEYMITDSGAFTAWSSGKEVDIDGYADWSLSITKQLPYVVSVNLDVIPGERGRSSTHSERIAGMKESLENADYLRGKGLNVMEVFHQDEPKEFLDQLIERLPPDGVLGISPRNDMHIAKRQGWLAAVLTHLRDTRGIDNLPRTHGLAVTAKALLETFPFYSADSSSWVNPQKYGTYINEEGRMTQTRNLLNANVYYSESRDTVTYMLRESITNLMRLGEANTSLWKQRGITWEDTDG